MEDMTVFTRVGNQGQEIYAFEFRCGTPVTKAEISITGNLLDTSIDCFLAMQTGRMAEGIKSVTWQEGTLHIDAAPFSYQAPYTLKIGNETFTAAQAVATKTLWADDFRPGRKTASATACMSPRGRAHDP